MDWSLLPDFLSIARQRTLAGAARQRQVNHSTMFRRLNQLEEQLSVRLFERLPDGYQLTTDGERLLPFAERMEAEAVAMERNLAGGDATLRGVVRLTAPDNIAYRYLPDYLVRFREQYPQIRVELLVTNADLNLNRREADVAIRATREPPEYLVGRNLLRIHWGVFASPEFIAERGQPARLDELAQWPLIGPDASLLHIAAFRWFHQNIPEDSLVARASNLMAMAALARAGLGLSILPDDQIGTGLERLMDFPPGLEGGLWLLTHPDLRQTGRIRVLMEFLTDAFRNDPQMRDIRIQE